MILPFPLVRSTELASVLRPGAGVATETALRCLSANQLRGAKVEVVLRSGRGVAGRSVWYSSLMLDVARLHRQGDGATARQVLDAADRLVGSRPAGFVAKAIAACSPDADAAEVDAASGGALSRLALLTESARREFGDELGVRSAAGVVIEMDSDLLVVQADDGSRLGVIRPLTTGSGVTTVGAPVVIDFERLDGLSSVAWVRPGVVPIADPHARASGPPRLLTAAERERIGGDLLVVA